MNNRSYIKKICYNINTMDLTETYRIKDFEAEIIKIIINLTKNYDQFHIEEFEYCNYEETHKTIRILDNIRTFLESL